MKLKEKSGHLIWKITELLGLTDQGGAGAGAAAGGFVGDPDVLWQASENRFAQEPPHQGSCSPNLPNQEDI